MRITQDFSRHCKASSKEFLKFILGQLSDLHGISHQAMMGEFILYYKGKIIGGIYDDRLLVKPVPSAIEYMTEIIYWTFLRAGKGNAFGGQYK